MTEETTTPADELSPADSEIGLSPADSEIGLSPAEADHRTDLPDPAPRADELAARAPVSSDSPAFSDFDIKPEIVQALADVGITRTFAIQELTLPIALAGNDLIGQARTGTGKTLGFGVPLLNRLTLPGEPGALPQSLVVAPTRELAVQVSADLASAGKRLGARVLTIYGGRAYEPQIEALKKGVDVVVGTPGRLLDLAQQGHLKLSDARILVLDEADEMLDLGFLPDIEKLLAMVPAARQTLLFSATMPGPIVALARQFLIQPVQIRAEQGTGTPSTSHIDQFVYRAHALDKVELISRVLQARGRGLTLIFTRTKRTAAKVADELENRGFAAAAIHGDLGQGAREQALRAFRSGKVDVLVATDVAARGLDVEGITHVINYQAPEDAMTYVHRIGRTARAGAKGTAVTLVDWDDIPRWKLICDELELPYHEPVETYSSSSHLYLELDIPEGTKGTLPRSERTREGLDAERIEDLGGRDSRTREGSRDNGRGRSGPSRSRESGRGGERRDGERRNGEQREGNRPQRNRSRTRGGRPVDQAAEAAQAAQGAGANAQHAGDTPVAAANGDAGRARRRRRGGRGRGQGQGGNDAAAATPQANDSAE
ncbi:DEAD/DEAH box helicase [uncultured Jatrophihabitans sp.]|uniref:DEAD/DEAH box helicase n=1 Tax=uncultured Jatrophihabitans sp. TaxID=1610747 RepID=UPI0035C9626A